MFRTVSTTAISLGEILCRPSSSHICQILKTGHCRQCESAVALRGVFKWRRRGDVLDDVLLTVVAHVIAKVGWYEFALHWWLCFWWNEIGMTPTDTSLTNALVNSLLICLEQGSTALGRCQPIEPAVEYKSSIKHYVSVLRCIWIVALGGLRIGTDIIRTRSTKMFWHEHFSRDRKSWLTIFKDTLTSRVLGKQWVGQYRTYASRHRFFTSWHALKLFHPSTTH